MEIKATLYDRPITYAPSDINDEQTPSNLLYEMMITSLSFYYTTLFIFYKDIVFLAQAEYLSAEFRLKISL